MKIININRIVRKLPIQKCMGNNLCSLEIAPGKWKLGGNQVEYHGSKVKQYR